VATWRFSRASHGSVEDELLLSSARSGFAPQCHATSTSLPGSLIELGLDMEETGTNGNRCTGGRAEFGYLGVGIGW
jgi:hypothetical protein